MNAVRRSSVVIVCWDSYGPLLRQAAVGRPFDLTLFTHHQLETAPAAMNELEAAVGRADFILYYRSNKGFWDEALAYLKEASCPDRIAVVGADATYWAPTTVSHQEAMDIYAYLTAGGLDNCKRLLDYLSDRFLKIPTPTEPPTVLPWQGIVHPDASGRIFASTEEYLQWYRPRPGPWVGMICTRAALMNDGLANVEFPLVREFERQGANVIVFYSMSTSVPERDQLNIADSIRRYFVKDGKPRVGAVLKLSSFLVGFSRNSEDKKQAAVSGTALLKQLNIPFYQPVMATRMSLKDWQEGPGLTGDVAWNIAFPEFEGMIEPLMLSFTRKDEETEFDRVLVPGSVPLVVGRILRRLAMAAKPPAERKVVFFLNNNPCASVEANVGGASHLDTHESVANVLKKMKTAGYEVEPPADGRALIKDIMDHKAISEFRWTTAQEISAKGGVLYRMDPAEYLRYFNTLPEELRKKIISTWGEPPGQGMVLDGKILITGRQYGNAVVAVQPKRGCFGARCDGEVCKILHDPLCPPTHQYLATYFYYEEIWGADVVVHVGTHGNLEFLPGKTAGVGASCYPMVGIGRAVHLYLYNSDNPPEGTIAKRRSAATLVDHMQCVMAASGLYEEFAQLDDLLAQYERAKDDPTHAHQLRHMIVAAADKANLKELDLSDGVPLDEVVRQCHEALSRVRNSQMNLGMHIIGALPQGEARTDFINSILRYDAGNGSLPDLIAGMMDTDLAVLYADQGGYDDGLGMSNGRVIELIGQKARTAIGMILAGKNNDDILNALVLDADEEQLKQLEEYREKVQEISRRIDASDEIGSLLNGFAGGYVEPGPSGVITRGRPDILPTGRNFYSLDPGRVPTETAWRVGQLLADKLIANYQKDEGAMPETVGFFWMCNDLLMADGEVMAQMMALLGVRPVWAGNGQVKDFAVIPPEELVHPRIDLTVRISGIMRDNFMNCIDLLDRAVRTVAVLDEPPDRNFVRKHTMLSLSDGADEDEATARFFSAPPGSYVSGVNLAVFASAWKTEKDLSDIFIAANGYAYGGGRNGKAMHAQFAADLKTVNITYNKVASDEHDLLGCCCYFSTQGGMTAASRQLSGKDVKAYYGDTREPKDINVHTLADEVRRTVRTKLLNPRWIEGEKAHGYKGATDMMKRITRVYGWQATTREVDDWVFDDITKTFVNDPEMRKFFQENNPWALEEISRRMLEANQRGLWQADDKVLEELKENYVEVESWMEDLAGEGEYQGGSIDIKTADEVDTWSANMGDIMKKVQARLGKEK
ncbi:MAG: cobaltochelatase subunit CobN [Candidatus Methanomethylophilus sp.]|nr:cobaltochelatase subunit CobN [Methanomethylophilus sp.]